MRRLVRRFATKASLPPGLSPRIVAFVRRADGTGDTPRAAAASADAAAAAGTGGVDAPAEAAPAAAARAALVARNSAALVELRGMLGAADGGGAAPGRRRRQGEEEDGDDDGALLRDVRDITRRSRRGEQTGALASDAALVMMRHDLGVGRDGAARLTPGAASAAAAALRERRDAVWQNIMGRGTDAAGVGWLLRGFFQDHVRQMDSAELAEVETVLQCGSVALASYVAHAAPAPAHVGRLPAFRLLCQYYRFWSGAGHEPGGEYV